MSKPFKSRPRSSLALELFQPAPNSLYSLDSAAHLAGVSRRSLLIYCRAGFINPVFQPPYGVMGFSEEAIYAVRQIEHLRAIHRNDTAWLGVFWELVNEVKRLRAEVCFLRNQ